MSLREKIRLHLPLYLVVSVIFSVAVWSLWLPHLLGNVEDVEAAPVTSFVTPITAVGRIPSGAQHKMIYNNGSYAMVFASNTSATSVTSTCAYVQSNGSANQACKLYFTSSTDGGVTWRTPVLISSDLFFSANREAISDFSYDTRRNAYVVVYKQYSTGDLYQSYSTNGGTSWASAIVISDNGASSPNFIGRNAVVAYATSSDMRAVLVQKGSYMAVGISTDRNQSTVWTTSTVDRLIGYYDTNAGDWESARPLGISIDSSNNIHALYAVASSTALTYNIIYASSTNSGSSWATTSISGTMGVLSADLSCMECGINASAIDPYTGRLSVMYFQMSAFDATAMGNGFLIATSSLKIGQLGANGQWTTSTLSTQVPFYYAISDFLLATLHPSSLIVPYTGMYAGAFMSTSSRPHVLINTSTRVIEQINTASVFNMSAMTTAYNSTSKELAVGYIDSSTYQMKFTTTSLAITALNAYASTTAITPTVETDGSGLVAVDTTISDANRETVTLYADYSTDGGTTWASTTMSSATGVAGALSTATGRVTGIKTTAGTLASVSQNISFDWDSLTDLPATSTTNVLLRIKASDGISDSPNYNVSSAFTVDNFAYVPTSLLLVPSTSTIAFSWSGASGDVLFSVSSTAMAVSSTVYNTVTSTSLTPNSLYYYQVKAQDDHGTTSSLSSVTSTYTDADIPTAVSAVSTGQTTMTVSWTSTNGSGTVYELYNVTTGATVGTTQSTSYSVTGLTANTAYQFKVRAQYLIDSSRYSSYSETSTAVSTDAASASSDNSSNSGGGGSAPAASPPSVPASQPVTPAAAASMELALNQPVRQTVGASSHTYTALSANAKSATLKIQSEPITVALSVGVPKEVDTNADSINDLRVTYTGLVKGVPKVTVANLTDENELKNVMTIRAGAYETNTRNVTLTFNSNAVQMALSNTPDFAGATFRAYAPSVSWELSSGNGKKTVYARLRSPQGSTVTVSDSIVLNTSGAALPPSTVENPPITTPTQSTYPVLTRTLKRNMTGTDVKQAQLFLQTAGFFPKTVAANGIFGPTTESSVKALQKKQGLPQSGEINTAIWSLLTGEFSVGNTPSSPENLAPVAKPNLSRGSSGANVLWVQEKLKALGYFPKNVNANSFYGPTTQSSVRAFQKAKGISQTGTVGPLTWGALSK